MNSNSLRYKIVNLRHVLETTGLEIVAISDTKLSDEFPDEQFSIEGYSFPPYRRDRNQHSGDLMVFIEKDVIRKRLIEFESSLIEVICIELTVSKNKWAIFSVYRLPKCNITLFFSELRASIDKATRKYDRIIIIVDININSFDESIQRFSSLTELCDIFCLQNLIRYTTCETSNSSSSVDVVLTNKSRSFQNSSTVATGISDVHNMNLTSMRANYERLKPVQIRYRSYRHFREDLFLHDLGMMPFHKCSEIDDKEKAYELFKDMFLTVVNRHAPLKTKTIRGTQAPFMNKELSSAIMDRSKLGNVYNKTKSIEAWEASKEQRNTCVSIKRKNIQNHLLHHF